MELSKEIQKKLYDTFLIEMKKEFILVPRVITYTEQKLTRNAEYIQTIINFVCNYYQLEQQYVISGMRKKPYPDVRKTIAYIAFKYADRTITLSQIGNCLNGKDHATVLYGIRTIQEAMKYDKLIRNEVEELEKQCVEKLNLKQIKK